MSDSKPRLDVLDAIRAHLADFAIRAHLADLTKAGAGPKPDHEKARIFTDEQACEVRGIRLLGRAAQEIQRLRAVLALAVPFISHGSGSDFCDGNHGSGEKCSVDMAREAARAALEGKTS